MSYIVLLVCLIVLCFVAEPSIAQIVEDKQIVLYSFFTYLWVFGLACFGGAVSFYRKVKAGAARVFNFTELVGELATSAFAGLITFMLCDYAKVDPRLSAVFIAITGHMGSRAIFAGEKFLQKWFANRTGVILDQEGERLKTEDPNAKGT